MNNKAVHSFFSTLLKTRMPKMIPLKASIAVLLLAFCSQVSALVIMAGSDYLETTDGTYLDFVYFGNPFGPSVNIVDLMGDPIGPGSTDTIVKRKDDAILTGAGSSDTIDIEMVALSLSSVDPVDIGGTLYDVATNLSTVLPTFGQMTITLLDDVAMTGTFESFFDVFFEVVLYEVGTDTVFQSVTELPPLHLEVSGLWGPDPEPGTVLVAGDYGDLDANSHPAPFDDYIDFFIQGEVMEQNPAGFVHRAKTSTVPEPSSLALLGLGLAGIVLLRKKTA